MGWFQDFVDSGGELLGDFAEVTGVLSWKVFTGLGIPQQPPSVFTLPLYETDIIRIYIPTLGWINYSDWTWGRTSFRWVRDRLQVVEEDKDGKASVIWFPEGGGEVRKDKNGVYYWTYMPPRWLEVAENFLEGQKTVITLGLVGLITAFSIRRG